MMMTTTTTMTWTADRDLFDGARDCRRGRVD
jgi:hypothetical protein